MADWYFTTPEVEEAPMAWEIPLSRYRQFRGVSVLETSPGVYELSRYYSYTYENDLKAAGLEVYRGGYQHIVDDATRAALIAAGIGITASNFTPV